MPIVALFKGLHSPNQARSQLSSPYEVSIRVYRLKVAPGQVDRVPLVECQSVYKLRQTPVKLSLGWISLQPRPSPRGNEAAAAASFPLGLIGLRVRTTQALRLDGRGEYFIKYWNMHSGIILDFFGWGRI